MHPPAPCRAPLRHAPLYLGVLMLTGLWIVYVTVLVLHPELLTIDRTLFHVNLSYAMCAIATTLMAYIEVARHLREEQSHTDSSPCTEKAWFIRSQILLAPHATCNLCTAAGISCAHRYGSCRYRAHCHCSHATCNLCTGAGISCEDAHAGCIFPLFSWKIAHMKFWKNKSVIMRLLRLKKIIWNPPIPQCFWIGGIAARTNVRNEIKHREQIDPVHAHATDRRVLRDVQEHFSHLQSVPAGLSNKEDIFFKC